MPARIGGLREGVVFVPFHYGYWDIGDDAGPDGRPRAANELTMTIWDPVSKQPQLKTAAVKVERVTMKIGPLLAHLRELETGLAAELRAAAERHREEHDVYHQCQTFAWPRTSACRRLEPLAGRYDGRPSGRRSVGDGSDDLLEELRTLYLRAQEVAITWTMAAQAAKALRDRDLLRSRRSASPRPRRRRSGSRPGSRSARHRRSCVG